METLVVMAVKEHQLPLTTLGVELVVVLEVLL
jgi:hypothetical protein